MGVCGRSAVLQCPGCGVRHPVRFQCGHRACGRCAGIQRWKKVQKLWPLVNTMHSPRFLTLTFRSRAHLTPEWRRSQFKALRAFLKNRWVKERIGGGVWAWEVTYNQRLKMWHPHFHILFDGQFMPHAKLKALWREITGDSFIVDIREIDGGGTERAKLGALRETVKYITKAVAFVEDARLLSEFLEGTKGMRRIGLFGKYHGYKAPPAPAADKRFWHVNPFTGRGPRPIACGCGYEALPNMWEQIGGRGALYTDSEAEALARERGSPDPVLEFERKLEKERTRDLTFEEVFG